MLRSIYVRRLKPGVSDEDYRAAWMPEGLDPDDYPARATISHSTTDERLTVTVFELDVPAEDLLDALPGLVRPDWRERVAAVVESTELEAVFEDTTGFGSAARGGPAA